MILSNKMHYFQQKGEVSLLNFWQKKNDIEFQKSVKLVSWIQTATSDGDLEYLSLFNGCQHHGFRDF